MEKYIIKGNYPASKYINLVISGKDNLHKKMDEILLAGYEITIKLQLKQNNERKS